ncbi:putative baseplate assembly protein [Streptomyces flaveus]|uniref:putative baseplate assembly protein n=1 Tax=Streptomyces flaveus TaxID=66370 RepID=UPI00331C377F
MPLPLPKLDSRTWQELTTEARELIAHRAPGWTDHNAHDPGITLMELFAWLTELELFQLDRVPPAALRGFLRLAGVEPRPAGVATTVVALRRAPGSAGAVVLPAGFQVCDTERVTVFESVRRLSVSPAWLELSGAEGTSRGRLLAEAGEKDGGRPLDVTGANLAEGQSLWPFGERPRVGNALRLGFTELPAGPGDELSLQVWTPEWETDRGTGGRAHYWARTVWEYLDGGNWAPLLTRWDGTRALTHTGRVVLRGPTRFPSDPADGRHWIRCRLASGGYECPPRLLAVAVNAVEVHHAETVSGPELLGVGRGAAGERFELGARPVVAGSTRIQVADDDSWREVAEWDRTGSHDRHYLLDPVEGVVSFGDGRVGRVPAAGSRITATRYQVGGGAAGNIPAGQLTRLVDVGALESVVQPLPAVGGGPAEELSRAHGRLLELLARPERGVTAADLETLALRTPEVPVGRAHAVPGHHPAYGCLPAAGAVTVVVLPRCGEPPTPSPGFLKAVRLFLEPRRPLCTELRVVGPTYVPVTVRATLHPDRTTPPDLASLARDALDAYFDPLTGGPGGSGRPFGRDVLESEVMALLDALPGVRFVDGLGISGPDDTGPRCGNLPLCATELALSGPHSITLAEVAR